MGLDRNDRTNRDRVTSRGYGVGQFTLFHHPPTPAEVSGVMLDPARNVERAAADLRDKFDHFVLGATGGTRADDRLAEIGEVALRLCRYPPNDPKYLRDCRRCALEATSVTLGPNTPLFPGAAEHFQPTPYHPEPQYRGVPDRKTFGCDWPYAVRRYNGSGVNSYHYQAQVLIRLARDSTLAALLTP